MYSKANTKPDWYFSQIITLTSMSGVGGSSAIKNLESFYRARGMRRTYVSGGSIHREFARKLELSIEQYTHFLATTGKKEGYDERCDEELKKAGMNNYTIVESRLAHVFVPHGFHVLLTCPTEIRAERRKNDPGYEHHSVEEVQRLIDERDANDRTRHEILYPGSQWPPEDFDLVIDTSKHSKDEVLDEILHGHSTWRKENASILHRF